MALLVSNVPLPDEGGTPSAALAERLGIAPDRVLSAELVKRSVDGRRRPPVWVGSWRVELSPTDEVATLARALPGVRPFTPRDRERAAGSFSLIGRSAWPRAVRPIIVGAGPAGLFAALRLAEAGAPAVLLDRGGEVDDRHQAVRRFWRHGELDPESNVVFGEGGAGTFSDGKIYTRRRDGELGWVFRRLVDHGADPAILEEGWAHLGTDRLREILPRIRQHLERHGVEVRYRAKVTALLAEGGLCRGVTLADGEEIVGTPVLVAPGHSARDTWRLLLAAGATAELRPVHIGARIEHPQRMVDLARYGAPRGELPPASYRLTSTPPGGRARPAHTFCMCPGGTVVPATNHPGRVVVNGMSYSRRASWWANSAVVVEVRPEDYGADHVLAGVDYQDAIEVAAFTAGGGGFRAPAQLAADFLAGRVSQELPRVSYPRGVTPVDLHDVLPPVVTQGMEEALRHFERRLAGFTGSEAVLIAPETRTSSPIRFLRRADFCSTGLEGLLLLGEGAGYAGGIASAALDGFRAANALIGEHCAKVAGTP